jgi:hypothetical protein
MGNFTHWKFRDEGWETFSELRAWWNIYKAAKVGAINVIILLQLWKKLLLSYSEDYNWKLHDWEWLRVAKL